jgi:hypothetical protein
MGAVMEFAQVAEPGIEGAPAALRHMAAVGGMLFAVAVAAFFAGRACRRIRRRAAAVALGTALGGLVGTAVAPVGAAVFDHYGIIGPDAVRFETWFLAAFLGITGAIGGAIGVRGVREEKSEV